MFGQNYSRGGTNWFLIIIYLVFILYFLNYPFSFIKIPELIANVDKWIIFVGGILLLVGAINYMRVSRRGY